MASYLWGENDLLDLHLVEQVVALHRLGERHDLIKHEAGGLVSETFA